MRLPTARGGIRAELSEERAVKPRVQWKNRSGALKLLGISSSEEWVYRALLRYRAASAADLAACLGGDVGLVERGLVDLSRLGLATRMPGTAAIYIATPPEFAVTALVKQQQAALEQIQLAVPDLVRLSTVRTCTTYGDAPTVEVISEKEHLIAVMARMYRTAVREILVFQSMPILTTRVMPQTVLNTGVRVRSISDHTVLETPSVMSLIDEDARNGEDTRTTFTLPFKMMIFDGRVAVVTVPYSEYECSSTMLIRGDITIMALCSLFEDVWHRATPISPKRALLSRGAGHSSVTLDGVSHALVPLLRAGLNDKTVAAELGISSATLNRRIGALMKATGARTRFQLGWQLASNETRPSPGG